MTGLAALVIGLLVGFIYVATRRITATSSLQMAGGSLLVTWKNGAGRTSVLDIESNAVRLSPPIMREDYAPPKPGAEVLMKPLGGGPMRRGEFVAHGDAGWTVRLA